MFCTNYMHAQTTQVWINQGDIILISLRDFQDDKADVIVKYTSDEARSCACLTCISWCSC
jgi:initiation factor 1A